MAKCWDLSIYKIQLFNGRMHLLWRLVALWFTPDNVTTFRANKHVGFCFYRSTNISPIDYAMLFHCIVEENAMKLESTGRSPHCPQ